jgi:hypothetical protein
VLPIVADSSIKIGWKLTDFDWQASKLIATDSLYKANKDDYAITLTMRNTDNETKQLAFKMNAEQLTDLHQSLQQALKIIEGEANNFVKNI